MKILSPLMSILKACNIPVSFVCFKSAKHIAGQNKSFSCLSSFLNMSFSHNLCLARFQEKMESGG